MTVTRESLHVRSTTNPNQALKLELVRVEDRFSTTLRLLVDDQETTVLRSVEGDGGTAWPPSPVIQDLSKQEGPSGVFLAGLGMAGKSHWSVVIRTIPDSAAIEFDLACRVKKEPEWIGSTYSVLNADSQLESAATLKLEVSGAVIRCETLTDEPGCCLESEPGRLTLVSNLNPGRELPRTIRWKYRFSL